MPTMNVLHQDPNLSTSVAPSSAGGMDIHPQVQSALMRTFQQDGRRSKITTLTIGGAAARCLELNRASIEQITFVLRRKPRITHLRLLNIAIQGTDGDASTAMVKLLQETTSLTSITLWSSRSPSTVTTMTVRAGGHEDDCDRTTLEYLARGLANNDAVTRIKFCHFYFAPYTGTLGALASMLKGKTNFQAIEFEGCTFDCFDGNDDQEGFASQSEYRLFLKGLASQSGLLEYALQFCMLSDTTAAGMLKQLGSHKVENNHNTNTSSLRRLSLYECTTLGPATFQSLNRLLLEQRQLQSLSKNKEEGRGGLEELALSVDFRTAVNTVTTDGTAGRDWFDQWKQKFAHTMRYSNDSLQRFHILTHAPDKSTNHCQSYSSSHDEWYRQVQRDLCRNQAIAYVRQCLVVKKHVSPLPTPSLTIDKGKETHSHVERDNKYFAVWVQAVVTLLSPQSSVDQDPDSETVKEPVGLSAGYLILSRLLPQLACPKPFVGQSHHEYVALGRDGTNCDRKESECF